MKKILILILSIFILNGYGQDTINLKEINITSYSPYRANINTPITFKNLYKTDIDLKNYGQEPSYILNTTPSITSYSESGGNNGYSYIRLRGIDQTRINFSLNGVPLNEPEDQGCYFSNYPDFLESIEMIQIQRGSGMNKNGVSSYGGSIILESIKIKDPSYIKASIDYGSYESSKISFGANSKFKNGGVFIYFSDLSTEGYKYHSGNKSGSIFLVSDFKIKKNDFKIVGFLGRQLNQLAWLGVPIDSIEKDRKINGCTTNENDDFSQYHIQLHYNREITKNLRYNQCIYYNYLDGHYSFDLNNFLEIKELGPIYSYYLTGNFVGTYVNFLFKYKNLNFNYGFNGFLYNRQHIGTEKDLGFLYKNTGYRNEFSTFIKVNYNFLKNINIFGDIQYRYTDFRYSGDVQLPYFVWNFLNFNLGTDIKIFDKFILYYSYGLTNREPTRNDIFKGNDNLLSDSIRNPIYNNMESEKSFDNELGIRYLSKNLNFNFNLYHINYKNEISLNGQYGPTGLPLHENVKSSIREGIELDFKYLFNFGLSCGINTTYNKSVIESNNYEITPVLSPEWLVNADITYRYKWFKMGLSYRYQDWSFIDFSNQYKISSFYNLNSVVGFKIKWVELNLFFNNITNQKYLASGQLNYNGTKPLYFVGSTFNCMGSLRLTLKSGK